MSIHHGQIVELIVRKKASNINHLAQALNISRHSLYNSFNHRILTPDVIKSIGAVIQHDFSNEFSEIFPGYDFEIKQSMDETLSTRPTEGIAAPENYKDKYISLLEDYNELLLADLQQGPKAEKCNGADELKM